MKPLDEWYRRMKATSAANLAELKLTFPTADLVGSCTVFNVGGNKYRVITKVAYGVQKVFMRAVLTHQEYDDDKWKPDCGK